MRTKTALTLFWFTTLGLAWLGCDPIADGEQKGSTSSNIDGNGKTFRGTNLRTLKEDPIAIAPQIDIQPANGTLVRSDDTSDVSLRFTGFTTAAGEHVEVQVLKSPDADIAEGNWVTIAETTSDASPTLFNDTAPIFRYDVEGRPGGDRRWRNGGVVRYRTVVTDKTGKKTLLPFFDVNSGTCLQKLGAKSWKQVIDKCRSPFSPNFGAALGSTKKAAAIVSSSLEPEDVTEPDFLSRHGFIDADETNDYYDEVDAPETLDDFRDRFGFDREREEEASYYNLGDLGIGREMHCTTFDDGEDDEEGTACYVRNYGIDDDGIGDFSGDADGAMEDLVDENDSFAAVCMVKFGRKFAARHGNDVMFVVYDANENIVNRAQLDSIDSNDAIPNNCLNCHGGIYDRDELRIMGASFLPFDPEAFLFTEDDRLLYRDQEDAFRELNVMMKNAGAPPGTKQFVDGLYGGKAEIDGTKANLDWIPQGWSQSEEAKTVYREVYKPYCRTCHTSQVGNFAFMTYEDFKGAGAKTLHSVCDTHEMPLAEATMINFWESGARAYLLNAFDASVSCHPNGDE